MSVIVPTLIWLSVNFVMGFAAWSVGRRLFRQEGFAMDVLHTIVLSWACIVGAATLLGMLGLLSAYVIMAVVSTVTAAIIVCLHASKRTDRRLTSSVSVESGSQKSGMIQRDRGSHWYAVAWCVMVAFWLGRVVAGGLLRFPSDWDSLMYHIPLIDHWLQEGTLYVPACPRWYFPGNNELLGLWVVAPFSGDFLIGLTNLPSVVLLAAAAFALMEQLGVSRLLSHWAAFAVVTVSPVVRQLVDAENDVAVAALFLTCLCYSFRYLEDERFANLALASVTLGLLAGVKYYAAGYAAIGGLTLLLATLAYRGPKAASKVAIASLAGGLLFSGYWYVRNAVVAGTPLYPQGFTEQTSLFTQLRPKVWNTSLLSCGRSEVWPLALKAVWTKGGLVQVLAVLFLPFSLACLVTTGVRFRSQKATAPVGILRFALAAMILETGMLLAVTPNVVETRPGTFNSINYGYIPVRFGLCFLSISVAGFVIAIQEVSRWIAQRASRIMVYNPEMEAAPTAPDLHFCPYPSVILWVPIVGVLVGMILIQVVWWYAAQTTSWTILQSELTEGFVISGDLFIVGALVVLYIKLVPKLTKLVPILSVLGIGMLVSLAACLEKHWHEHYASFYDRNSRGSLISEIATLDPATNHICACDYRYYPFFGSRRQFRVCRPIWAPSYASFRDYLRAYDVNLLVVPSEDVFPGHYASIKRWVEAHPTAFAEIAPQSQKSPKRFYLFRVNQLALTDKTNAPAGN